VSWREYFPEGYEKRPDQLRFIEEASELLAEGGIYVVSAPCGIGKSLAALVSALPLVEEGKKLIFTYRTRNQIQIYLKELRAIGRRREREYLQASLVSKQSMCPRFSGDRISYGALVRACRILRENSKRGKEPRCAYYSKILEDQERAMKLALEWSKSYISPLEIVARAEKAGICPYEAVKLIMPEAEVFLGTYHYLLDPGIREGLLSQLDIDLSECVGVIDEAHNLSTFARDLLSSELQERSIRRALDEVGAFGGPDADEIEEILLALREEFFPELSKGLKPGEPRRLDREAVRELFRETVGGIPEMVAKLVHDYGEYVWGERLKLGRRIYSYNHRVGEFLMGFLGAEGAQYARWAELEEGETKLELRNLDGRELTDVVLEGLHSAILMSGTLTPAEVHGQLLAFDTRRMKFREFKSPFPPENRLILVARDVSSRMEERTEQTYRRWREYIEEVLRTNRGNVGVFFTSYELMKKISGLDTEREVIVENRKTTHGEVIGRLSGRDDIALFGVIGGKFSEGVDYPGELLTCAVVVGFPYASWDDRQRALTEYMNAVFPGKGRLYGYLAPAITRFLQTCGRIHRSKRDRGCVVILDKRVRYPHIRRKLPKYFQREMRTVSSPEECGRLISQFWEKPRQGAYRNASPAR